MCVDSFAMAVFLCTGGPGARRRSGVREFGSPLNGTAGAGWAAVGEFVSNAVHFFNLNARWRL